MQLPANTKLQVSNYYFNSRYRTERLFMVTGSRYNSSNSIYLPYGGVPERAEAHQSWQPQRDTELNTYTVNVLYIHMHT